MKDHGQPQATRASGKAHRRLRRKVLLRYARTVTRMQRVGLLTVEVQTASFISKCRPAGLEKSLSSDISGVLRNRKNNGVNESMTITFRKMEKIPITTISKSPLLSTSL